MFSGALEGDLGGLGDYAFKPANAPNVSNLAWQQFHQFARHVLDGVVGKSALILLILGIADKTVALDTDSLTESGPCHIAGGTIAVIQQPFNRCVAVHLCR